MFCQLAISGIAVQSFDAHGHGRSEPSAAKDRGFVRSYTDLVGCLLNIFVILLVQWHSTYCAVSSQPAWTWPAPTLLHVDTDLDNLSLALCLGYGHIFDVVNM